MAQARLMTQETDYKRLGLKKNEIEMWENGTKGIVHYVSNPDERLYLNIK